MESFFLAVSVVIPLLIYMLVGGLIRRLSIFSQENFRALNTMIFRILIPLTLFFDVYEADLKSAIRPEVFGFAFVCMLCVFFASWVVFTKTVPERQNASTMIQGVYRSNFVLFGTTIAVPLCTADGQALVAALAAMVVPLVNILAVVLFEVKRGGEVSKRHIVINIFKNPLVDAGLLGCACNVLGVPVPELIRNPLVSLGSAATPLALVTLGGLLSFGSMVEHRKLLAAAVAGRLLIVPGAALGLAALLGFRGSALVAFLAIFASPTAVASAPMAQSMGGNGELAGEIVAATSVCCILTIFLFVFGMSAVGFI